MRSLAYIYDERCLGVVEKQMVYGAIIRYSKGGIEFNEMLASEDYEVVYDLDDVMEEFSDE